MLDVAPTELVLVLVVALVIIGPKDLPKAMRFVGKWLGKARGMARHFRSGLDTMMREAELEELEKQWRQQNEEIMRQFPSTSAAGSSAAATTTTATTATGAPGMMEGDAGNENRIAQQATPNPDFDAAGHTPTASGDNMGAGGDADLPPETHQVPPRGSELP